MSQDLKTGYIVGATPKYQQWIELFAALLFAGVSGLILMLLHSVYTVGTAELPAPATAVISILTESIFNGQIMWELMLTGVAIGVMLEMLHISVLPFAIGVYLPIHLTVPVCIGGIVKYFAQKRKGFNDSYGTLFASGLVAGDALVGIIIALFAYLGANTGIMEGLIPEPAGSIVGLAALALLCAVLYNSVFDKPAKQGAE
jgi:putative OPT family oligopeptide transporter